MLTSRWKTVNASASVYWPGQAEKTRVKFRCQPHCPRHRERCVAPLTQVDNTLEKLPPRYELERQTDVFIRLEYVVEMYQVWVGVLA